MPRSTSVVSTVPGTVATYQFFALKLFAEIAASSPCTLGASLSIQPFTAHWLLPSGCNASRAGGRGFATGAENGALLCGICAASCGARYPACPRVCTGHGFEPSSYSTTEVSLPLL